MDKPRFRSWLAELVTQCMQDSAFRPADCVNTPVRDRDVALLRREDRAAFRKLSAEAKQHEGSLRYADAALVYEQGWRIASRSLGPDHPDAYGWLHDQARCQLNGGDYEAALENFLLLLRLLEQRYGVEDELVEITRSNVSACQSGVRSIVNVRRLWMVVDGMIRSAVADRTVEILSRFDRARRIACRLASRGRRDRAIRLHEAAIALRLAVAEPDQETVYDDLQQYAKDLCDAGQPARAVALLCRLVLARNRMSAWSTQRDGLPSALADLEKCLLAHGDFRSAQEVSTLAESVARRAAGQGPNPV